MSLGDHLIIHWGLGKILGLNHSCGTRAFGSIFGVYCFTHLLRHWSLFTPAMWWIIRDCRGFPVRDGINREWQRITSTQHLENPRTVAYPSIRILYGLIIGRNIKNWRRQSMRKGTFRPAWPKQTLDMNFRVFKLNFHLDKIRFLKDLGSIRKSRKFSTK